MSGTSGDNPSDALNQGIDLSELQNLQFGPDWTEDSTSRDHSRATGRDERRPGGGSRGGGPARKDRRSGGRPERRAPSNRGGGGDRTGAGGSPQGGQRGRGGPRGERDSGARGERRGGRSQGRGQFQPPFQPTVDVLFYPEDIPFRALTKALRASMRTYELFEIARLILDKPDRFVVVVKQKGASKHRKDDDESSKEPKEMEPDAEGGFVITLPDGVPFENEDAALSHVLKHQLEQFFRTEEVEVEPPKGSFQFVNRCSITGVLLGPPNYHRYQAIVQAHHAERLAHMPFERFQSKIEQVREQEVIDQWMQQMTKATRYILKEPGENDPPFFESAESAKHFLASQRRAKILRKVESPRMSGKQIEHMPETDLRRSIETVLEQQHRFPLDTANNLRGRLRRMRFNIYKRGSKGVSYVSAIKRKFRDEKTRFSESIEGLIQFLEAHPNISITELPEKYLGLDLEALRQPLEETPPAAPADTQAPAVAAETAPPAQETATPTEAAASATDAETTVSAEKPDTVEAPAAALESEPAIPAQADAPVEAVVAETSVNEEAQAPAAPEAVAADKTDTSAEASPADAESVPAEAPVDESAKASAPEPAASSDQVEQKAAAAAPPAKPQDEFPRATPEQKAKLRQMSSDLRWLVAEGYVTEFGDGTLFAPPAVSTPAPKPKEPKPAPEPATGSAATQAAAPPVAEVAHDTPVSEAAPPAQAAETPAASGEETVVPAPPPQPESSVSATTMETTATPSQPPPVETAPGLDPATTSAAETPSSDGDTTVEKEPEHPEADAVPAASASEVTSSEDKPN
ncbi:MAG: hypothetical protein ACFBZ8_08805 [Opitutales bacterium]